jgi:hypothetical protein
MTPRIAFVLTVVLALFFTYAESRTWVILLVAYAAVHALVRYGSEATLLYYDERRRRILAGQRP